MITYKIHNILKIKSSIPLHLPDYFLKKEVDGTFDLSIIKRNISLSEIKEEKLNHLGLKFLGKNSYLCMKYRYFSENAMMIIKELEKNTEIIVSPKFHLFYILRNRLRSVFWEFMNFIIFLKLLMKGYTFIHAGAVKFPDGKCVIYPAWSDTGKTSTTEDLVRRYNASYLGDDLIITDGNNVYSFPHPLKKKKRPLDRFPLLCRFEPSKTINAPIEDKGKVMYLTFLERSEKEEIKECKKKEMKKRIFLSTLNEISDFLHEGIFFAYEYFTPSFSLFQLLKKHEKIIDKLLRKSKFYIIRKPSRPWSDLIWEVLERYG